jgi:hypothetical protein
VIGLENVDGQPYTTIVIAMSSGIPLMKNAASLIIPLRDFTTPLHQPCS